MKEQSDTPRTDAAARQAGGSSVFVTVGWRLACDLERELATATRERDEARAEVERMRSALQEILEDSSDEGARECAREALSATEAKP